MSWTALSYYARVGRSTSGNLHHFLGQAHVAGTNPQLRRAWARWAPAWLAGYGLQTARADVIAGIVVLFLTIPQVIAYAYLAGMPPAAGLYAAIAALLAYAFIGSSRVLVVGPTAIVAMMTLEAVSRFAEPGSVEYAIVAAKLALLTGLFLIGLRVLRFGSAIGFLSHAVVTGFISAAAVLIIVNQLPTLLGLQSAPATSVIDVSRYVAAAWPDANGWALAISVVALLTLFVCRQYLCTLLVRVGMGSAMADALCKSAPMFVVVGAVAVVGPWRLDIGGVEVVGDLPRNLPTLDLVAMTLHDLRELALPALLIALVIFLESISIGTAVASKRRQRVVPNQELGGLGVANIGASLVGAFPVAGSFARTMVNFSVGALTPVASLITALGVVVSIVWLAPLFYYLPKGVLAAIIVISAASLIDISALRKIFEFNRTDAITLVLTFAAVLLLSVEIGMLIGVLLSFGLLIRSASKPHMAEVGRYGSSEHFRNVLRYSVNTCPEVLAIRVDESLYFVNARFIENQILQRAVECPDLKHVLLICSPVNFIDTSGLEMLENLEHNLSDMGVTLHFAEIKGPVMDQLEVTQFYRQMQGRVFFTTDLAMRELGGI